MPRSGGGGGEKVNLAHRKFFGGFLDVGLILQKDMERVADNLLVDVLDRQGQKSSGPIDRLLKPRVPS